mmetsp:Transcript_18182/g.45918  ORF Transcript_18182/g.45918 Transcript_18182/m.45918 type:complete len:91 (-) Transcript_18182:1034-1306(-)
MKNSPSTEAALRREFERRPPAVGATPKLLKELEIHYAKILPVQQRKMVRIVRRAMLRMLISCDGANSLRDHVAILENELRTGVPAPVPEW